MNELMKDIVSSEAVQEILQTAREEKLVTPEKYTKICESVQAKLNNDTSLLLEPIEIATIIEEAILIYSNRRKNSNFPLHTVEESVDFAFRKQLGTSEDFINEKHLN